MHRILSLVTLAAAAVIVTGTVAATQLHASKHQGATSAQVAAGSFCPDPAHCPYGSCSAGKAGAAAVASAPATEKGSDCSNPAACATSCPRIGASTTAAVAAK